MFLRTPPHTVSSDMLLPSFHRSPWNFASSSPSVSLPNEKTSFTTPKIRQRVWTKVLLLMLCFLLAVYNFGSPVTSVKERIRSQKTLVPLRSEDGSLLRPAKVAFATILTHSKSHTHDDMDKDEYFLSTRTLCYQLLHAEETRNRLGAPCVVLATPGVREDKKDRLRKDGATVISVSSIQSAWAQTEISTWTEMFSKLHLFRLTQYDLVAFMDNDVVLTSRLDGIFQDPAVVIRKSKTNSTQDIEDAESMPKEYVFAALAELNRKHSFPPSAANNDFPNIEYFNAGFFVFQPSKEMFEYHMSVLEIPNSFDASLMEQNLWNHVYRQEGNMPWTRLKSVWNIHYPTVSDVAKGAVSVHDKFWFPHTKEMAKYLLSWRWRMHGFYEAHTRSFYV